MHSMSGQNGILQIQVRARSASRYLIHELRNRWLSAFRNVLHTMFLMQKVLRLAHRTRTKTCEYCKNVRVLMHDHRSLIYIPPDCFISP